MLRQSFWGERAKGLDQKQKLKVAESHLVSCSIAEIFYRRATNLHILMKLSEGYLYFYSGQSTQC